MFIKVNRYDLAALIMIAALSFSTALPNIFLGLTALLYIYQASRKKFKIVFNKETVIFLVLLCYLFANEIIVNKTIYNFNILSRCFIVLILPVLLLKVSKIRIAIVFIASTVISILLALFNTSKYYFENKIIPFENGEIINKILMIERPYLGFICLIASVLCLYVAKQTKKYKIILYTLPVFFFLVIVLIVARLSLITGFVLFFLYIFFFSNFNIYKRALLLISSLIMFVSPLFVYKNLANRFLNNLSYERIKLYDPRIDIWDCVYNITKEKDFNIYFGSHSYQKVEQDLVDCYKTKSEYDLERRQWFVTTRFNTHNQFLDFFMVGGLVGLSIFLYFLYFLIKLSKINFYYFSLILSLLLFFLFENVLQRQYGCYMTGIILTLAARGTEKKI